MQVELIAAYLKAFRALDAATRRAEKLATEAFNAAQHLKNWQTAAGAGVRSGVPFNARPLDGAAISEAFSAWADARKALLDAWDRIPAGDRFGLEPPPGNGE
jgi:hypothetical protein